MKEFMPSNGEKPVGPKLSQQDYEKLGHDLLKVDPSLAKIYLKVANVPAEEIGVLIEKTSKPEEKGKEPPMTREGKIELFENMAAELEKDFERSGGKRQERKELAEVYRKEAKKLADEGKKG